jgi:methionyl-tRNA synthetase
MTRKPILVTSALPYANGSIHLGHLVEYIQTDVFVRFLRLVGEDVLYVCADDTHGTPIEMRAAREKVAPEQIIARYHEEHQRDFADFQIEFDYYGSTNQDENRVWAERIFEALRASGHVDRREVEQAFCPNDQRFLPDRFIRGTCPFCKAPDQYGDQCEACGETYQPTDLIDPRCAECGTAPVRKSSMHYFVQIADFADRLREWTSRPGCLQPETRRFVEGWLEKGLKDWDVSRDAPYFGFKIPGEESKYFYVWLDAPIGYISTTERWCREHGRDVEAEYWKNPGAEIHHVIGKDIVYFHTLFWPAMLMAAGLELPRAVHVHGHLTVNGEKMSKTRGTFINARTYLDHLDPLYLRYYYATKLSGSADDLDLSFEDFSNRVNAELVNKIVNLASRSLQFVYKRLGGRLGALPDDGRQILAEIRARLPEVEAAYRRLDFAAAVHVACEAAERGNLYVQDRAPFNLIKTDPEAARAVCTTAANILRIVAIIVAPVVPSLSDRVLAMLDGQEFHAHAHAHAHARWDDLGRDLENVAIGPFERLLDRIDPAAIERIIEASKTAPAPPEQSAAPSQPLEPEIDFETFVKVDLRVARVVKAEPVDKAKKLLRLTLDVGPLGERNVLAGIRISYPDPAALVGKNLVLVANLAPRAMRGEVSQGMICAAGESEDAVKLAELPADATPGDRLH